jgi:tetratricopeptide (TPR) repeat protein
VDKKEPATDGDIGKRVRQARLDKGLSQTDLASALEVSTSYVSLIESGRRPAPTPLLGAIAARLALSVEYLQSGVAVDQVNAFELDVKFAELALRNGDVAVAEERFKHVVDQAGPASPREWLFTAKLGMARVLEAKGSLEESIQAYESLLENLSSTSVAGDLARVRIQVALCRVYSECGDLAHAIELGEAAMSLLPSEPTEDPEAGESHVALVSTLAGCYFERGDLTRAHLLAQAALARARDNGLPLARAAAYWNASLIAEARGDLVGARRFADRALAIYAESDNLRAVALLKLVAAWLILRDDEPALSRAEALLQSALVDLPVVGSQVDIAYGEIELARCRMLSGDWQDAIRLAEASIERLGGGARLQGARARLTLGQARLLGGDHRGALQTFAVAAADLREIGADRQAAAAWRELAEVLIKLGRPDDALDAYRRAADSAGVSVPLMQPTPSDAAARRP